LPPIRSVLHKCGTVAHCSSVLQWCVAVMCCSIRDLNSRFALAAYSQTHPLSHSLRNLHWHLRHDSSPSVTRLLDMTWCIHMCDVNHSYVWHDSFMCVTWWRIGSTVPFVEPIRHHVICNETRDLCNETHVQWDTWLDSVIWDLTPSYVWGDLFVCDMTPLYVWRDSFLCVMWLIHMCNMTQSYTWDDSLYAWHSIVCHTSCVSH